MQLNDFEENVLNNFISNIRLFNNKQSKDKAETDRLKKAIKSDSLRLEEKYGAKITLNQAKIPMADVANTIRIFIAGLDLHSQLIIQGLGDYISHFRNLTLDIENKCIKDEFGNTFVKESDYVALEFMELDTTGLYIRANSILSIEIDDKLFTIYVIQSKILFVDVSFTENNKTKKPKKGKTSV